MSDGAQRQRGVVVDLAGVVRRYGDRTAVGAGAGLDLHIAAGEFVILIGASGCGKSTLLRLVAGLDDPTAGRITVDGRVPADAARSKRIALVPQEPALLPWRSVRANASLLTEVGRTVVGRADASRTPAAWPDPTVTVDQLLDAVGLAEASELRPHQLSGGMRQRVALVRALALAAPLLLMDEPFAALDEITRGGLRVLLRSLRAGDHLHGATVLFTTHSLPEAVLLGDRVIVMGQGGTIVGEHVVDGRGVDLDDPGVEDDPRFTAQVSTIRRLLVTAAAGAASPARGRGSVP